MLDSLPERPLTNDEAERLKQQDGRIVPLSTLKGDGGHLRYLHAGVLSERGKHHPSARLRRRGRVDSDNV